MTPILTALLTILLNTSTPLDCAEVAPAVLSEINRLVESGTDTDVSDADWLARVYVQRCVANE